MFDTDLTREHERAASAFGIAPRSFYDAGVRGALCDEASRARLAQIGAEFVWPG
jgi:aminodeoxyfutalosine deaminase